MMPEAERLYEIKNERLAEKRSFEGNCEILSTIFQPRALSSNLLVSQEGVYLFFKPLINFFNAFQRDKKETPNNLGIIYFK